MSAVVQPDSTHLDLAASLATCVERNATAATRTSSFDVALWRAVGEVGLFGLGVPGDDTLGHLVTGCVELGRRGVYGPLAGTLLARDVVPDPDLRARLIAGVARAALVGPSDDAVPWGGVAEIWLLVDDDWRVVEADGEPTRERSMAGEEWVRCPLRATADVDLDARALASAHLAIAAWATGAATAVVEEAAEYAGSRVQFGRPIASFQAVSHPLAMARARLTAIEAAVRMAASRLDRHGLGSDALAARLAATDGALEACLLVHQVYGAVGFICDGPIGFTAQRIRELATIAPDDHGAARWLSAQLFAARSTNGGLP